MRIAMIFVRSTAAVVLVWLAAIAIIEGGGSGCGIVGPQLVGSNEVPPNDAPGHGFGSYELSVGGVELRFVITAEGLSGPVTAAHFHNAPASEDGPIVLDLAPFLTEVNGQVGIAGSSSFSDWSIENVPEEIRAGRVYVNLHSDAYPDGEIRGQVFLSE